MIEGIPDGWELVRIGQLMPGDHWLRGDGRIEKCEFSHCSAFKNYVIIRKIEKPNKIEKPKQFRPFANAAEFRPHRERWMTHRENTAVGEFQVVEFNDIGIWCNCMKKLMPYKTAFEIGLRFDDGTPFGIEVTE